MKLSLIFEEKPESWGFRGDPYFWDHLKEHAENMEWITPGELEEWIKEEYRSVTGKPLTDSYNDFAVVEKFKHGGMSSGGVDNRWWVRTGIPLLKSRLDPGRMSIEELLDKPYWIIDILPEQVPENSSGQYFAVEEFYRTGPRRTAVRQKHIDLILKLNCYLDMSLDEDPEINPDPERIAEAVRERYVSIRIGDALIVSDPDDTYLTVYNPGEKLLALIERIASGEGLFVWQPGDAANGGQADR